MQGAGTLALQLLGEGDSTQAEAGVRNISENNRVVYNDDGYEWRDPYIWYYQTQAVFHGGTKYFRPWNKQFAPVLIKYQHDDGHWEAKDAEQVGKANPYFCTTLCALTLQVYYRYLPTYQEPEKIVRKDELFDLEEDELGPDIE